MDFITWYDKEILPKVKEMTSKNRMVIDDKPLNKEDQEKFNKFFTGLNKGAQL